MKKLIGIFILILISAGAWADPSIRPSGLYTWKFNSAQVIASNTATVYTLPGSNFAYGVSFYNQGTNTVFVQIGNTTNGFVAAQAMWIPAGATYSSDPYYNFTIGRNIKSIIYQTTNGTSGLIIGFE